MDRRQLEQFLNFHFANNTTIGMTNTLAHVNKKQTRVTFYKNVYFIQCQNIAHNFSHTQPKNHILTKPNRLSIGISVDSQKLKINHGRGLIFMLNILNNIYTIKSSLSLLHFTRERAPYLISPIVIKAAFSLWEEHGFGSFNFKFHHNLN